MICTCDCFIRISNMAVVLEYLDWVSVGLSQLDCKGHALFFTMLPIKTVYLMVNCYKYSWINEEFLLIAIGPAVLNHKRVCRLILLVHKRSYHAVQCLLNVYR